MSYKCKNCQSDSVFLIEYGYTHPGRYDGWSEMGCQDCKKHFGRWTEKEIPFGYYESRFGKQGILKYKKDE